MMRRLCGYHPIGIDEYTQLVTHGSPRVVMYDAVECTDGVYRLYISRTYVDGHVQLSYKLNHVLTPDEVQGELVKLIYKHKLCNIRYKYIVPLDDVITIHHAVRPEFVEAIHEVLDARHIDRSVVRFAKVLAP